MSERGAFITEYIYCAKCFKVMERVLLIRDELDCNVVSSLIYNEELPIIAGKISGGYNTHEILIMEDILRELYKELCHPIRMVVLAENGQQIFIVGPLGVSSLSSMEWENNWDESD